jgi:hypothetical protein
VFSKGRFCRPFLFEREEEVTFLKKSNQKTFMSWGRGRRYCLSSPPLVAMIGAPGVSARSS